MPPPERGPHQLLTQRRRTAEKRRRDSAAAARRSPSGGAATPSPLAAPDRGQIAARPASLLRSALLVAAVPERELSCEDAVSGEAKAGRPLLHLDGAAPADVFAKFVSFRPDSER